MQAEAEYVPPAGILFSLPAISLSVTDCTCRPPALPGTGSPVPIVSSITICLIRLRQIRCWAVSNVSRFLPFPFCGRKICRPGRSFSPPRKFRRKQRSFRRNIPETPERQKKVPPVSGSSPWRTGSLFLPRRHFRRMYFQ